MLGEAPVPGRTCFPVKALGALFLMTLFSSYSREEEEGLAAIPMNFSSVSGVNIVGRASVDEEDGEEDTGVVGQDD